MRFSVKKLLAFTFVMVFFSSCLKDPNHSVRVKNQTGAVLVNVKIGNANFSRIEVGASSSYQPLDEGDFSVSGTSQNGGIIEGTGKVKGRGTHRWTLTVPANGLLSFIEDK
jgi:hypothetical protein